MEGCTSSFGPTDTYSYGVGGRDIRDVKSESSCITVERKTKEGAILRSLIISISLFKASEDARVLAVEHTKN